MGNSRLYFKIWVVAVATSLVLMPATQALADKKKEEDAIKGALIGAGVGALVGDGKGAAAGAVVGAIIGANK
ncbi:MULTISPECIES: glycine zipper 2TM domain-containing protein [unclassified Ruegeria]|uniref:glycine zipper 2TM domain-containing protein n=1 Tax=unclassified Ruegeria TaxID=2625375 RepID=UPI0014892724|nr:MULTISPECIES: glycine zipper 2TM domain-containing protein [unclassified Ruegeria]